MITSLQFLLTTAPLGSTKNIKVYDQQCNVVTN